MDGRMAKTLGVFLAVGVLVALTLERLPYWVHLGILVGGVWLMFQIWDARGERKDDRRED